MTHRFTLTVTSLLSILLLTFHLSEDVVRGFEPGGFKNVYGVLILVVWLYGTLALTERRAGYVIMLLGALLGAVVPLVHMRGAGLVGGRIAGSSGVFFWVWTLVALGVTSIFSLIFSARGLWSLQRGVKSAEEMVKDLDKARKQVDKTSKKYDQMFSKKSVKDRRKAYKELEKELKNSEDRVKDLRKRAEDMQKEADKFFSEWSKGLTKIQDAELRGHSHDNMTENRSRYGQVIEAGLKAGSLYGSFVTDLENQLSYFQLDMSDAAMEKLTKNRDETRQKAKTLFQSADELDHTTKGYIASMK